jgi:hypothetical protein
MDGLNRKRYIILFRLRVNTHFEKSDINLDDIAPIVIPENPSWLNPKPTFNFELTQHKNQKQTCIRNRTIGYRIIQCVLGFPVNDCVPMNTYMTRDPCENYMFTNSSI